MAWIIAYALAKKVQRTAITIPLATNLDFGGYRGINVGSPVNPGDIFRLGDFAGHNVAEGVHGLTTGEYIAKTNRADQLVARAMMEYPTVDVTFQYLQAINKIDFIARHRGLAKCPIIGPVDTFADKAIEVLRGEQGLIYGRIVDDNNFYAANIWSARTTADFYMLKIIAGTITELGYESIDLSANDIYNYKFSCLGTTLAGYREDMVTPKISVTDTALANGKWGLIMRNDYPENPLYYAWLRAPSSLSPKPIAYFEVPIIGDGSEENPFRPQMPEELTSHPELGTRNLLALSHASLIPSDPTTGRPIYGTCLVRIFEQPDRDPTLRDIPACLDALRGMTGVTELTREDAISRARVLDDKLHLFDLVRVPTPVKDQIKEYIEWRRTVHKVEMPEEVARRYLESDKGW